jgi:hypothetical protein
MSSYVLGFEDFQPGDRVDGAPWTSIQIEESPNQDGPYSIIDTIPISPVDLDPSDPAERSFTTSNATMAAGWYRITFLDDAGGQQPVEPLYHSAARSGYMPGVGDVGALLTARTRDSDGVEAGTFTSKTRPTKEQVERLIEKAATTVVEKVGADPLPIYWEPIASVIALSAALRVELSFFPDQVNAGRSAYAELKKLRDEELADLIQADPAADNVGGMPVWTVPTACVRAPGAEWPVTSDEWYYPRGI